MIDSFISPGIWFTRNGEQAQVESLLLLNNRFVWQGDVGEWWILWELNGRSVGKNHHHDLVKRESDGVS